MTKKNSKHSFFFENDNFSCESHLNGFTEEIYKEFDKKAKDLKLEQKINDLFEGKKVNKTEQRAATHVQLRNKITNGEKEIPFPVTKIRKDMAIVVVGIGGSYWGNEIINRYRLRNLKGHRYTYFVKNYSELWDFLDSSKKTWLKTEKVNLPKVHFFFLSKSFTTVETINCLKSILPLSKETNSEYTITAITANPKEAEKYGIDDIITIDESIGGRYSIWSNMNIPSFIEVDPLPPTQEELKKALTEALTQKGNKFLNTPDKPRKYYPKENPIEERYDSFKDFINGGYCSDVDLLNNKEYFEFVKRLAYSDIWMHNFENRNTRAILSYANFVSTLPYYLQQLEMESLGKPASSISEFKKTGQVILPGHGQNAQHSYLQLFHQGTHKLCADIITSRSEQEYIDDDRMGIKPISLLEAQAVTQSKLFSYGATNLKDIEEIKGDTPSNLFRFGGSLESLGYLIATWEHRVFITSVMLQINPFDQFGVNAGKIYTNKYIADKD